MFRRTGALTLIMLALAACSGGADRSAVPDGDPKAGRKHDLRGYSYGPDVMAGEDEAFFWAQQAVSDYARIDDAPALTAVADLPPASCHFPTPEEGDAVRFVIIERGVQEAPIYQFSSRDVGERAATFVKYYSASGGKTKKVWSYDGSDIMRVVNVAVTETSAPVYLVLSSETNVLWNILPAPGVKLSRIALVSSGDIGLANAPEETGVNLLPGSILKGCHTPSPMRRPQEDWGFVQNVKESGGSYADKALANNIRHASNYQHWLTENFGAEGLSGRIAQQGLSNVLIGPLPASPDERAPYRPVASALLSKSDYRIIAPRAEYHAAVQKIVTDAAREAAGGDLEALAAGAGR